MLCLAWLRFGAGEEITSSDGEVLNESEEEENEEGEVML